MILGEFRRTIDERFRLSIPGELLESWEGERKSAEKQDCVLVKQQPGCVSLWRNTDWQANLESGVRVVESKWAAGRLSDRMHDVQALGRLLSTRHRSLQLAGRGRLLIPEGFRDFLGVEAGQDVLVIGAAICIEIWEVQAWVACLNSEIPRFGEILDELSR
ncbi:MAG: division/cell wall cluster transcriptional repressor MraZ [Planctomycetaceae bacterium]|nr:division/cell wall cluster transcriptional repressor MraZ [Planctomycetaceae bacterium]